MSLVNSNTHSERMMHVCWELQGQQQKSDMTLFSCGETLRWNGVFLTWKMEPHTDLFDANCWSTEQLNGTWRHALDRTHQQVDQSVWPTAVQFCFFTSLFTFMHRIHVCCTFGHGGLWRFTGSCLYGSLWAVWSGLSPQFTPSVLVTIVLCCLRFSVLTAFVLILTGTSWKT